MTQINYVTFWPKQPGAAYSFLYPAEWTVREILENGATEVFVAGPASRDGTSTLSFAVRVSAEPDFTPEDAAAVFLARYRPAPGFQERGRSSRTVAGSTATETEIAYATLLPLNSVNARPVVIREHRIFFRRADLLYEILYAAPEGEYDMWLDSFRTLVQTFSIIEEERPKSGTPRS